MKIINRYIVEKLIFTLLASFLAFIIIFIVVDIIEHIDNYIDAKATIGEVLLYYLYYIPYIIVLVAPVTTLLGATITCIIFSRHNEIVAMRASGLSTLKIASPILTVALILSFFFLVFGELVVPRANALKNEIKNEKIDKVRTSKVKVVQNIVFKGENREVYYINRYFANRQQGIGIMIQYYDENAKLNQRIDAKQLVYENNNWKLIEGYQRFFADSTEHAEKFDSMSLNINVTPDDFSKKQTDPEQMGFFELKRYINKVESWGGNPIKEKVDLLIKISFPFANFIILLFGVPFTLRFRKKGAALGFAQSLLLAFFYYGVIRAGQAFGYNGAISPFTAAFLGNILFLSGGMVLLFLSRQ